MRFGRYAKANDLEMLPPIRVAIDERSTFSYRRIAAVISTERAAQVLTLLNHTHIYRVMAQNRMQLTRYSGKRHVWPHEGEVVTLHSNTL